MKRNLKQTLTLAAATAALGTSLGVTAVNAHAADAITVKEGSKTTIQQSNQIKWDAVQGKVESVQGKVESVQGKVEAVQGKVEVRQENVSNQIKIGD